MTSSAFHPDMAAEKDCEHQDKKVKTEDAKKTMDDKYPCAPDSEWPEAWYMPDEVEDQCKPNKLEPNQPVTAADMKKLGICYWKMDADSYEYPTIQVPWDPKEAMDPKLKALRDARGYSYADIITVHPDHLPEFEKKIKAFFEEHIHDAVSICHYCVLWLFRLIDTQSCWPSGRNPVHHWRFWIL